MSAAQERLSQSALPAAQKERRRSGLACCRYRAARRRNNRAAHLSWFSEPSLIVTSSKAEAQRYSHAVPTRRSTKNSARIARRPRTQSCAFRRHRWSYVRLRHRRSDHHRRRRGRLRLSAPKLPQE
jgi:hypothetical protein